MFVALMNVVHSWEDIICFHLFSIVVLYSTDIPIAVFFYILQESSSALALFEDSLNKCFDLLLL